MKNKMDIFEWAITFSYYIAMTLEGLMGLCGLGLWDPPAITLMVASAMARYRYKYKYRKET